MYQSFLVLLLLVLSVPISSAHADDFQEREKDWKKWIACASDDQWMPIAGVCSQWEAVNKQFKAEGEAYQRELDAAVGCPIADRSPTPRVGCVEYECAILPDEKK